MICSRRAKTVIASLMMMVVVIIFYIVIVYGMLRESIEEMVRQNTDYGLRYYYNTKNYKSAEKCFKKALFLEKYIIFWDDNINLPICYQNMALGLEGMQKFEKAADMYEKALSAYEKYQPESEENMMNIHTKVSLIYSILGNNSKVIEHAGIAHNYYQSLDYGAQITDTGTAALELAYGYYNTGRYENAAACFEIAIPIIYNRLDWSMSDTGGPTMLAIAYRVAADTYEKLGNEEMKQYYEEKYWDIVWIREISDGEIEEYMELFHWGDM